MLGLLATELLLLRYSVGQVRRKKGEGEKEHNEMSDDDERREEEMAVGRPGGKREKWRPFCVCTLRCISATTWSGRRTVVLHGGRVSVNEGRGVHQSSALRLVTNP